MFAPSPSEGVFRQGEVVSNLIQVHLRADSLAADAGEVTLEEKVHPYALILTQDCDLDWDFKARATVRSEAEPDEKEKARENRRQAKLVPNVLLCELATVPDLRPLLAGGDILKRVRGNLDERYYFLPAISPTDDRVGEGLAELVADFKRVFSIPTDELYFRLASGLLRRSVLQAPHLQHMSSRFGYYCLRVALPEHEPAQAPTGPSKPTALPAAAEGGAPAA